MRVKLDREEIALAMELRSEGVYWHHIAEGLGVADPRTIRKYVRKAEQHGIGKAPEGVCSRVRTNQVQNRAREILAGNTRAPAPTGQASRKELA